MKANNKNYEMDMTTGPLFRMLLTYSLPVIATGVLQCLYNAADMVVAGNFAGSQALAAVGSTGSLVNLVVALFIGISLGVNVTVARYFGAKDYDAVSDTVHTAMLFGLLSGILLGIFGFFMARPLLELMDSPEDVIDLATQYLEIYFAGLPALMVYNYGAGILRAVGDTRRPLYYLIISGMLNVVLNLVTVIVFHMGVAGVAYATIASELLSAVLVVNCLMHTPGSVHFYPSKMKIHWHKLGEMVKIGLPAGIQSALFSVSNVLIQSSVNSFGSQVMAGCSAAANIEGFVYIAINSFSQATVTFTSQNVGAKKYDRIAPICLYCNILVTIAWFVTGVIAVVFRRQLLGLYNSDPEVISYGCERLITVVALYVICGNMEVFTGSLRGMGKSLSPMIVCLFGACILRVIWISIVFQKYRTLFSIFVSYPISWAVTTLVLIGMYIYTKHKLLKTAAAEAETENPELTAE
jgi:putative MATE family efflux protein